MRKVVYRRPLKHNVDMPARDLNQIAAQIVRDSAEQRERLRKNIIEASTAIRRSQDNDSGKIGRPKRRSLGGKIRAQKYRSC